MEGSNEEKGDATEQGDSAVTKYGETSFEGLLKILLVSKCVTC